jgi:hypothetical protein
MNPEILLRLIHDLTARAVDAEVRAEKLEQLIAELEQKQNGEG